MFYGFLISSLLLMMVFFFFRSGEKRTRNKTESEGMIGKSRTQLRSGSLGVEDAGKV